MKKRRMKQYIWGYFFIAPTIIGLLILNIYPIIDTILLSFQENLGLNRYAFLGIDNYIKVLKDPEIWLSIRNTLVFSIVSVPVSIFISLVLAWLMCKKIRGASIYRVIYFAPLVAASAAIAMVWSWIFNTEYGVLNSILEIFHVEAISWLNNPKYAMISIIIIAVWGSLGQQLIILIVSIKNISGSYFEAAELDGAKDRDKLFRITVPLISPNIFFLTVTGFIGSLSQFDLIYMIYGTGYSESLSSVQTIMYQYYKQAFVVQDKPYASSIAVITLIIILILTMIQFWLQKKVVVYE